MQLEIYNLIAEENRISISLEAICDSYSSLLWDIEFYRRTGIEFHGASPMENKNRPYQRVQAIRFGADSGT